MASVDFWEKSDGTFTAADADAVSDLDRLRSVLKAPAASSLRGISGDIYSRNEWDIVFLDGVGLPGICDVKGIAELKVDNKKAQGKDGSTITITGYLPGPFEVICRVWTPDQLETLSEAIERVWNLPRRPLPNDTRAAQAKRLRKPIAIGHPKTTMADIEYCIVRGMGLLEEDSTAGVKLIRFKCQEWRPPGFKNVTATPKKAPGRVAEYASGHEPKNGAPPRPSSNAKNLAPGGPPAAPAGGTH
jgi:hypothetical protein